MRNFLRLVLLIALSVNLSPLFAAPTASVKLTPENPEPNSTVNLSVESYSFDVNVATITWKINNQIVAEGLGKRDITIKTGEPGESVPVSVRAETANGAFVEQMIVVTPSSMLLLYEAPRSYVPVFYEGRSLPSDGGLARVTAFPELSDGGIKVDPSNLSFAWYVNGTFVKNLSGLGRSSANIRLDYLRTKNEVKVTARSPGGAVTTKTITITPHKILPLIYTYDPILGTNFSQLVEKRFETTKDFIFTIEPFYVSDKESAPSSYVWYLDGKLSTPENGRVLGLQPKENSYGSKLLKILVMGNDKRIQKTETSVQLIFDTRE